MNFFARIGAFYQHAVTELNTVHVGGFGLATLLGSAAAAIAQPHVGALADAVPVVGPYLAALVTGYVSSAAMPATIVLGGLAAAAGRLPGSPQAAAAQPPALATLPAAASAAAPTPAAAGPAASAPPAPQSAS